MTALNHFVQEYASHSEVITSTAGQNINATQAHLLMLLRTQSLTNTQLAAAVELSRPAITKAIKNLIAHHYVIATINEQINDNTILKNSTHRQITIVASTDFYAELAQAVVGSHGKATAIIKNQNISPEDYEPTTAVAKQVSQADIALANGLGYDTWLNKLAKASGQAALIRVGETVLKQKTGSNPHLWNNPETMIKTAQYLAKQLGKEDPTHKDDFQKNAKKYIASLKPIQSLITQISQDSNDQSVAQTEPVFEYMLKALGYHVMDSDFSEAIEAGNDPSPQH
ncbi:hypothetical protein Pfo_031494 [Paulownia fortunei]|nr:hypothetical protein Pfo_031494 [Paulownia fortunei]